MRLAPICLPALAIAAASLLPAAGHADPYRWCAHYSERTGGGGTNCGFVTLRQCQATISGIGGICEPNPFYTGSTTGSGHPRRHGRERDQR